MMIYLKNKGFKKVFELLLFISVALGLSMPAYATNHFIRPGVSGDGSDWNNAYGQIPASLVRGDTYYLADGSYTGHTFNDALSGEQWITIKKATESDHGTETGWQSSYGDGQAIFSGGDENSIFYMITGYYHIDGQTGGGPGSWDSGHGIKLQGTRSAEKIVNFIGNGTTTSKPTHFTFEHIEFAHKGLDSNDNDDCFYSILNDSYVDTVTGTEDVTIRYCYGHDVRRSFFWTYDSRNWTVEYNYFARNKSTAQSHGEFWKSHYERDLIFKYNLVEDTGGSAIIFSGWDDNVTETPRGNWQICGNVFFWNESYAYDGLGDAFGCSNEVDKSEQWGLHENIYIYNNIFLNLRGVRTGVTYVWGNDIYVYNNIWYNCENTYLGSLYGDAGFLYDYNLFVNPTSPKSLMTNANNIRMDAADSPIINWQNKNFSLNPESDSGQVAINSGAQLFWMDNKDMLGNTRGADGNWDRGAIEFNNNIILPQPPIAAAGLDQTTTDSQPVTLDASNSFDPDGTIVQWTWQDNLGDLINDGEIVQASLSPGVHTITLTVTDGEGFTGTDQTVITVNETNTIVIDHTAIRRTLTWWKLTEGSGGTARDFSAEDGFSNAQLVNNPTWTTNGEGLSFNGVDSYLEVADSDVLEITQPKTFTAWIKLNDYTPYGKILVKPHVSFATPWEMYALDLGSNGNTPRFLVTDGIENGVAVVASASNPIVTDQWYNIIGTYDGSSIRLYLDGQLQTTQPVDFTIGTNSMPLSIGGRLGTNTVNGNLSDIRIYNDCLTDEEVQLLYSCGRNDQLTAHFNLDDNFTSQDASVISDDSGMNASATAINDPNCGNAWADEYFRTFKRSEAVQIDSTVMNPGAGTIGMLVTPESNVGVQLLFGHTYQNSNAIFLYTLSGQLTLLLGNSTQPVADIAELLPDVTYHVALSWDGTSYVVYVDGLQKATGTFPGLTEFGPIADIANIGIPESRTNNMGFDGIIDDVRIYNRALSVNEIAALSNAQQVKENRQLSFEVYDEDNSGNQLFYTVDESTLPSYAVFNAATQTLTWVPWYDQAGDYQVVFVPEDQSDPLEVTVSVQDVVRAEHHQALFAQGTLR